MPPLKPAFQALAFTVIFVAINGVIDFINNTSPWIDLKNNLFVGGLTALLLYFWQFRKQ